MIAGKGRGGLRIQGAESREVTPTDIQVQNLIDSIEGGLVVIVHRRGYSVGR
jgi:hypothetical protein